MWLHQDLVDEARLTKERVGRRGLNRPADNLEDQSAEGVSNHGLGAPPSPVSLDSEGAPAKVTSSRGVTLSARGGNRGLKGAQRGGLKVRGRGRRSGTLGVNITPGDFKTVTKDIRSLDSQVSTLVTNTTRIANSLERIVKDMHTELAANAKLINTLTRASKDTTKACSDMTKKLASLETSINGLSKTASARLSDMAKTHNTRGSSGSSPNESTLAADRSLQQGGRAIAADKSGSKQATPIATKTNEELAPTSKSKFKKGKSDPVQKPNNSKHRVRQSSPSPSPSDSSSSASHDCNSESGKTESSDESSESDGRASPEAKVPNSNATNSQLNQMIQHNDLGGGSHGQISQSLRSIHSMDANTRSALMNALLAPPPTSQFQLSAFQNPAHNFNQQDLLFQLLGNQSIGSGHAASSAIPAPHVQSKKKRKTDEGENHRESKKGKDQKKRK